MTIFDNVVSAVSAVSAVSPAVGPIVAAWIATRTAKDITQEFKLYTYLDAPEKINTLIRKAKSDIFIVVAAGDNLLKTMEKTLEKKLRAGVRVRYLLLNRDRLSEMQEYMHGPAEKKEEIYSKALEILIRLQEKYPDILEVRFFSKHMTLSYIGIDTCPDPSREKALLAPFIQIMAYQYHILSTESFVANLYKKSKNNEYYERTVESMLDMWTDASYELVSGKFANLEVFESRHL